MLSTLSVKESAYGIYKTWAISDWLEAEAVDATCKLATLSFYSSSNLTSIWWHTSDLDHVALGRAQSSVGRART